MIKGLCMYVCTYINCSYLAEVVYFHIDVHTLKDVPSKIQSDDFCAVVEVAFFPIVSMCVY